MNVRLERNWAYDGYDVTFYERDDGFRVLRFTDDGPRWMPADPGGRVEPSLRLPAETLHALLAEAEKVIPASHATERHLSDAISVRDRLLALVEDGWAS